MERYLIIHGHFYQPPRKNPWTGLLARQPSASPVDNWNERILNECYMPNTRVRLSPEERVNNYELISHNLGPTLSKWMAESNIEIYRKLIEADKRSQTAIALPYNHTILPLDSDFIRRLQIGWGIRHFKLNYKRSPEGMWLPECAISSGVVEELVKAGIKFIFLKPQQIKAVKRISGYHWYEAKENPVDIRRPYRIFSPSGHLDVFLSSQELAVDISFKKILDNPPEAAHKIEKSFGQKHSEDLVLSIVTDGETFGHHHKGADIGLARLIKHHLPEKKIKLTTPSRYLQDRNPEWEAVIEENSSWSCTHGLKRWEDDCGCGAEEGSDLKWRIPLRESIGWLGDKIRELFMDKSGKYFTVPPEEAALNFGDVISNYSMYDLFCRQYVKEEFKDSSEVKKIIVLIHFTCYMFTSCGWFFGDLKRLEPVQNLSAALRAIELVKELWSINLEGEFYRRLNRHRDVPYVWNRLVKERKKSPRDMARDFMDIHTYTGIEKNQRGYWFMEVVKDNSGKKVKIEHTRTGDKFIF